MTPSPANSDLDVLSDDPDTRREQLTRRFVSTLKDHPEWSSLYARVLPALEEIASSLSREELENVLSQPSSYSALVDALLRLPLVQESQEAAAKLRGQKMKEQLRDRCDGFLSSQEVGDLLSISPQAVNKRRQKGKLIALKRGQHGYMYPAFQFDVRAGQILKGLEEVLTHLDPEDPWMILQFLLTKSPRLDDRLPVEMLQEGQVQPVIGAARTFGQHGSD